MIYVAVTAGVRFTSERSRPAVTSTCISHTGAAVICHAALTKHRQSVESEEEKQEMERNISM